MSIAGTAPKVLLPGWPVWLRICCCLMLSILSTLSGFAVADATGKTNTWLGKSAEWSDGRNWSAGMAPAGDRTEDVLIAAGPATVYPVLNADAAVGGSLRIAGGASLDLQGHGLQVGKASAAQPGKTSATGSGEGLRIESNATLLAEHGAIVTLYAGGLLNRGNILGKPFLRMMGSYSGLTLNGGRKLELGALFTAPSPFPYPVTVGGNLTVAGNIELAGGKLIIKQTLDGTAGKCEVFGDLLFLGKTPCVMLVTEGDLLLHGTVKSEGSAYCVETAGEERTWDFTDNAAYCATKENAGWVTLVGEGNQVITPGGILPALRLAKPTGKVTSTGDLHCNGLDVTRGNTLDLSQGQQLILGHYLRDWATNPKRESLPRLGLCRTSRDLLNDGTIIGTPEVPVQFQLTLNATRYVVACRYQSPDENNEAASGDQVELLHAAHPWTAPGALAVNRTESRFRLKDGKLLLDGKPCGSDAGASAGKKKDTANGKAPLTNISLKTVSEDWQPPNATPCNVAPLVERIGTPSRTPVIFTGNGPCWEQRDVYGAVDGDPDVGTGGAPYYDFIFPEPVTVGAVRLHSSTQLPNGCQFVVCTDPGGHGAWEHVLAWARDGVQTDPSAWLTWGTSWAAFTPEPVTRLRLQVLSPEGVVCNPSVNEFEIYADQDSATHLARRPDAPRPELIPAQARWLTPGEKVEVNWPETPPNLRVCRSTSTAFWMAGVSWSTTIDESAFAKMPPLRAYPACVQHLAEIKDRYHYDAVELFFEGEKAGVPWPTLNFKSALNARYLKRRETALKYQHDPKFNKKNEENDDAPGGDNLHDTETTDEKYSEPLKLADLPCQRNLLQEYCAAAHEKGLQVYMISRPEDMSMYTGPKTQDPYETFLRESAANGVDGVSLVPDEEYPLWQCGGYARWREFDERTKEQRKNYSLLENRRWIEERSAVAGQCLLERKEHIRQANAACKISSDSAHLHGFGDPYDVIWHTVDPDYVGCSYQSHLVPRWAATSKNRQVAMGEFVPRTVRYNLESLLLGARMIRSYRFNYIELMHSEDYRMRENLFIGQYMRWGATRPSRPPTALVVSRASESWWPADCKEGRQPAAEADRCWMNEEILYEFLLKNGYTFDVYYLDQPDDLRALKDYKLVILPFTYALSRPAFTRINEAYQAGTNFLVCDHKGEVDEVGQPYPAPLLADWIAPGKQNGRITFSEVNLPELATLRSCIPALTGIIDPLLGTRKDLQLKRYGNRIEAVVRAIDPGEEYASFINWENKPAKIEVGLNLPPGQYKLLTLSSTHPETLREGIISGEKVFSAEILRNFGLKLDADEVLSCYVLPAGKEWGKW